MLTTSFHAEKEKHSAENDETRDETGANAIERVLPSGYEISRSADD